MRVSLPINTFSTAWQGDTETGFGELNVFAAYLLDMGHRALSIGLGRHITAPTATDDALGSEKWSAGFAHVFFNARSPKFQCGYLLTWQHSSEGQDNRAEVNVGNAMSISMNIKTDSLFQRSKRW